MGRDKIQAVSETLSQDSRILRGITRDTVIRLAREADYRIDEIYLTWHDIFVADECLLTGTAADVIAVASLDGLTIGTGRPGPVTKDLLVRFRRFARVLS